MEAAYRIIDANANRAAEALRTLEEVARFAFEDPELTAQLKALRHALQSILDRFDRVKLLMARDAASDPGTEIGEAAEYKRSDYGSIVQAAAGRFQQAVRCLEEFSKLVLPESAPAFEKIRYRSYDLLAAIQLRALPSDRMAHARLYILTDCSRSLPAFIDFCREVAVAGCDVLQIRHKELDDRQLFAYAMAAKQAVHGLATSIIANDRADIALAAKLDGVHLGQEDLEAPVVRRMTIWPLCIGLSTHDIEQARLACRLGVDYIGCGPTFPSETKAFQQFAGVDFLKQVASEIKLPAFAIGGINETNVDRVIDAGFSRIAVSHCVTRSENPAKVVGELKERLTKSG